MRRPTGLFPTVVLAALLAVGFAVLWGVFVKWGYETARMLGSHTLEERLLFLADGTPVVERVKMVNGQSVIPPEEQFHDLRGNTVRLPAETHFLGAVPFYLSRRNGLLTQEQPWQWRLQQLTRPHDPLTWYFVCDGQRHGSGYFVAYDPRDARTVGYLGTNGFRTEVLPAEEHFPFNGDDRGIVRNLLNPIGARTPRAMNAPFDLSNAPGPELLYVRGDNDTIYRVDLTARSVRVAFTGQPIQSVGLLPRLVPLPDGERTTLIVRTDDAVLELDRRDQVVHRFPIPEDLRDLGFIWYETAAGEFVTRTDVEYDLQLTWARARIDHFDASGRPLRREEATIHLPGWVDERVLMTGILCPVVAGELLFVPESLPYYDHWARYAKAVGNRMAVFWPCLLLVFLMTTGLAWMSWRRLVKYGATRTEQVVWPLFVLVLGLPGWIGFRFARPWPVRRPCPACGVVVPRDRDECAACLAGFPPPALNGTEIFA